MVENYFHILYNIIMHDNMIIQQTKGLKSYNVPHCKCPKYYVIKIISQNVWGTIHSYITVML